VRPEAVEPAGNSLIVNTDETGDVGAGHADAQQKEGGLHEQQRFLEAERAACCGRLRRHAGKLGSADDEYPDVCPSNRRRQGYE